MGLFTGDKKQIALLATIEKHALHLSELKQRQAELDSKFRNLEMEWVNAFEKLKSISGRIAKRQALDNDAEMPPDAPVAHAEPDPYAHLDDVSARIMRRRAGANP